MMMGSQVAEDTASFLLGLKDLSWDLYNYNWTSHISAFPLQAALSQVVTVYEDLIALGDARVANWFLMASPWPTVGIVLTYVAFCIWIPKVFSGISEKHHVTLVLVRPAMFVYNLAVILLNAYIVHELVYASAGYNWICQPVDYSNNPQSLRAASALWFYYFSKLVEMLDSVFFLIRGKHNQLTFLHIYHHATMFFLWWIGVKYVAGGSSVFGALFNSCVHVLMYTYYLIAALGPAYRRFLGWKRHLTLIQMVQFVAALVMGLNALRVGCPFPMWMQYAMILYMISFLILFGNFYVNTYKNKDKDKKMA